MFEGLGVAAVEPAAAGVSDRLEGLRGLDSSTNEVRKAHIAALVALDERIVERVGTDGHGRASEARVLKLDERG